jgi:hypothetical protein
MEERVNPKQLISSVAILSSLSACGGGAASSPNPAPPAAQAPVASVPPPAPPPAPIQLIEFSGQSNSGQGGLGVTLDANASFPNVLQFAGPGKASYGAALQAASDFTQFEPASDDPAGPGQYLATMAGFAMGDASPTATLLVHTDWFGGTPISGFVEGSDNFANTVQAMATAKTLATAGVERSSAPGTSGCKGNRTPPAVRITRASSALTSTASSQPSPMR